MINVYFEPTTEEGVIQATEAETSAAAPQGVSEAQPTATTEAYTYSVSVDSNYYLSEDTGHIEADYLLSCRNILLLWFLTWLTLKCISKIHNSIKSMIGGVKND